MNDAETSIADARNEAQEDERARAIPEIFHAVRSVAFGSI
jgi:hypothetical protein